MEQREDLLCPSGQRRAPGDEQTLASIDSYDEVYAQYLEARGAKPDSWSKAILNKFKAIARPGLSSYYQSQGARLD